MSIEIHTLTIGDTNYQISSAEYRRMKEARVIYDCGGHHDLHLCPDGPDDRGWKISDVEALTSSLLGPNRVKRV